MKPETQLLTEPDSSSSYRYNMGMGRLHELTSSFEEAEQFYLIAYNTRQEVFRTWEALHAPKALIRLYQRSERFAEAAELLEEAERLTVGLTIPRSIPMVAQWLETVQNTIFSRHYQEAAENLERASNRLKDFTGQNDLHAECAYLRAQLLAHEGNFDGAIESLKLALSLIQPNLGDYDVRLLKVLMGLRDALRQAGRDAEHRTVEAQVNQMLSIIGNALIVFHTHATYVFHFSQTEPTRLLTGSTPIVFEQNSTFINDVFQQAFSRSFLGSAPQPQNLTSHNAAHSQWHTIEIIGSSGTLIHSVKVTQNPGYRIPESVHRLFSTIWNFVDQLEKPPEPMMFVD